MTLLTVTLLTVTSPTVTLPTIIALSLIMRTAIMRTKMMPAKIILTQNVTANRTVNRDQRRGRAALQRRVQGTEITRASAPVVARLKN